MLYWKTALLIVLSFFLLMPVYADNACDNLEQANASFQSEEYQRAFELYQAMAEKGCTGAQVNLGIIYYRGLDVEKDYKRAFELFLKGEKQNIPIALRYIGEMYIRGRGVKKNHERGVEYLKIAAELGNVDAQNLLGNMYRIGLHVSKDRQLAIKWYRKAAEQGSELAKRKLDEIASEPDDGSKGVTQELEDAQKESLTASHKALTEYYKDRKTEESSWYDPKEQLFPQSTTAYYIEEQGRQVGPLTTVEIEQRIKAGTLTASSLVWRDGLAAWSKAEDVPELSSKFQQQQVSYYVEENGQQAGPLTSSQIGERINAGRLDAANLVWREGLSGWVQAKDLPELQELFNRHSTVSQQTDPTYGYSTDNPIQIGGVEKFGRDSGPERERAYLRALRGPNGEHISFERQGSCCGFNVGDIRVVLDKYEIRYEGLDKPLTLYLDMYRYEKPKVPAGLSGDETTFPPPI